ncbi:MAG: hypothetical protein ATN34_04200 [Epulopiscium sp. Nele67-Bin002]|nr:MAG: hypothetical protein BEN18_03495 [Epulopiscium sp. Nuni2H_MBin001]OON92543.1 MAG: hypothetical protein ATN34_04200 [Epulopiscium sp. Nele67-Bin002]
MTTDIAALSISMSQFDIGTKVGASLAKLSLDMAEQTGASMEDMMKSMEISVSPNLGSQIDIRL